MQEVPLSYGKTAEVLFSHFLKKIPLTAVLLLRNQPAIVLFFKFCKRSRSTIKAQNYQINQVWIDYLEKIQNTKISLRRENEKTMVFTIFIQDKKTCNKKLEKGNLKMHNCSVQFVQTPTLPQLKSQKRWLQLYKPSIDIQIKY